MPFCTNSQAENSFCLKTNFWARKGVEQLHAQLNFMIIEDLFRRFSIKTENFVDSHEVFENGNDVVKIKTKSYSVI